MTAANRSRDELYARLKDVLGENDARTMMELLPSESFDHLATKADLTAIGDQLSGRMDGLSGRMDALTGRMDGLEHRMDRFEDRLERLEDRMERFEQHQIRFDERLHDFHGALRQQTRSFILASTGSVVTVAGLAFAAASLI